MKYMLDTNICIYIIKKKPKKLLQKFNKQQIGNVVISSITLCELEYGAQKSSYPERNKIALSEFLAPVTILNYDDKAAMKYGIIRTELEKKGQIIGPLDLLIATHALSENLILITNNEKEFKKIKQLKVENWV